MRDEIDVSVVCLTFNHGKFIEKTLESILAQITSFNFELIVHDDKSTDGTTTILRKYGEKYPRIIKTIIETENQYSKGIDVFIESTFPYVKGKYLAFCEGDDYWTDEFKLQKQYDIMERHNEVDMCASAASEVYGEREKLVQVIRPRVGDGLLTTEEVILGGGRYLATATLFCRSKIFQELMNFEKVMCFDYTYQMKGALRGGIYFIDQNMATYRNGVEGSWTKRIERNDEQRQKHITREIKMLQTLDKETSWYYHDTILKRINGYKSYYDQLITQRDEVLSEIGENSHGMYLWGNGMRGKAFVKFCLSEKIELVGVCDIKDEGIGEKVQGEIDIFTCDDVLNNAKMIVAANTKVVEYLNERDYRGKIINLQNYLLLS